MWYKIAEGPLDIVGKTLKVVTSLSDTPITASEWYQHREGLWELSVFNDEPRIRERILVLINFGGYSGAYVTNGTFPLTGIFVSENIRSISIAESEEVHQVESKYLPITPSVVFNNLERLRGIKGVGYARFRVYDQQEVDVSISDGSVIVDARSELLHSTSENQSDMGYLDFDRDTSKVMVHPGANRDVTTVCAIFFAAKDPDDMTSATAVSAIVTIESEGSM
jgi:hypothetical protein